MLAFKNVKEVQKYAAKNGIDFITLHAADIAARLRSVTIPARNMTEKMLREGVGFDASNLGFAKVHKSDMLLLPDLNFAFRDPVGEHPNVLFFFCDIVEIGSQKSFTQDMRHIVHKAVGALKNAGLADQVKVGVELEFNVIDQLYSKMTMRETSYRIESAEIASPPGGEEVYRLGKKRGYFRSEPNDHLFAIRNEIVAAFEKIGLEVKYHHHEVGASQCEIEFRFLPVEFMADATVLAKNICHRVARKHGKIATFIPKLIPGEAGNGMHVHQFLLKKGKNVFHDPKGLYKLSPAALSYIAGVLDHTSSLAAFTNPTSNSYRRLVPGLEAPVKVVFAEGNRSAAIRIPGYVQDPQERRFEFRAIDATCNPYLAYAAMIMAGLDGFRRGLDPRKLGFGPFEANMYELSAKQLAEIKSFPSSLEDALTSLGHDMEYLKHRDVFPSVLIDQWVAWKKLDIEEMRRVPHPWEIARYYDL
ncbi:MAG: type I glutamate--ammonia ligase [Elusimicrobiota bacterium]